MTSTPEPAAPVRIGLHADGVALVLDVASQRLPVVLHWGADPGPLASEALDALALAQEPLVFGNAPDEPAHVALLPEGRSGWQGRPGLTGSRRGAAWSPDWRTTAVTLDGDRVTANTDHGPGLVRVTSEDPDAALRLEIDMEMLPAGLVRARASLTNLDAEAYEVNELLVALPVPSRAREILDFAGRWSKERAPQHAALQVGTHWREARHGRTGADSAYLLHVGTPGFGFAGGEIWSVHTAWSGNHIHYAERLQSGEQVMGGGELLLPGEGVLAEAETYTSPWIYGSYGVGLDPVAARFHRWLRSRPHHPAAPRPVTINVWEAVYFDHDLDRLLDLAERAAALGVERFVLDDGWFGARRNDFAGLGDWVVSPDAWPNGLHPLIDRVKELGMEFGLWFEPEMVNPDSDVARAHPEWVMQPGGGRWPVESRHQQVLNIGLPDAYRHVRDQMMALLDEYAIDYIKWDHNRDLVEAGSMPSGAPGVHRQTQAFYRLVDELKAAHPGLEIEACASGGGRIDLEVMSRCDRVWVSDCIDPLERQQMHRWTAQLLPPELMGSHIASGRSHTTFRTHDLFFRGSVAVFGHLGIEWDLAQASEEELGLLGAYVAWFKEHREVLLGGVMVRADHPDEGVYSYGVVTPEKAIYSFGVNVHPDVNGLGEWVLPGLDPGTDYLVRRTGPQFLPDERQPAWARGDGVVLSGAVLGGAGIRAPWMPPEHSFLIEVTRVG